MNCYYNIYYLNTKINKKPLEKKDINVIMQNDNIKKKDSFSNEFITIPTNKIKIIKCTII